MHFVSTGRRDEKVEVMEHECLLSCGGLLKFCVGAMKGLDRSIRLSGIYHQLRVDKAFCHFVVGVLGKMLKSMNVFSAWFNYVMEASR